MKKGDVLMLNDAIKGMKMGKASKECLFSMLSVKLALSPIVKELDESRKTIAEELKPEGEETEEMKQIWNMKFVEFFEKVLSEEVNINLEKISKDDLYELVKGNDLNLNQIETINQLIKSSN